MIDENISKKSNQDFVPFKHIIQIYVIDNDINSSLDLFLNVIAQGSSFSPKFKFCKKVYIFVEDLMGYVLKLDKAKKTAILTSLFQHNLKLAEVKPIHKKKDSTTGMVGFWCQYSSAKFLFIK